MPKDLSISLPHQTVGELADHQSGIKPTFDARKLREEISKIPTFLEAIGINPSQVGLTLFGGDGGNWHRAKVPGTTYCQPININEALEDIPGWSIDGHLRNGHQLGFYPMRGGSTKAQSLGSPCLKIECDTIPKSQQLEVLKAFQHAYDVQFTIIDTGGKSLHAYLAVDEVIAPDRYALVCRCFHQRLSDIAQIQEISYEADDAVSRITQAMRLPGAIHRKNGNIATLLQLGTVCSLDQVELSDDEVEQYRRESVTQRAFARTCQRGQVLGYQGNEALQILASIAYVWDKRIPGGDTYSKVLPLIANLTGALGPKLAAQVLFDQGHNDKAGVHDLGGLLAWCQSFTELPDPAEASARLVSMALARYGWRRPRASTSIVAGPATEYINTQEELGQAIKGRSALTNCRTGKGKSREALREGVDMHRESRERNGDRSMFSVGVISPRRTINAQNAQITDGRDCSTGRGSRQDFYLACLKSWGYDHKRHGNPKLWRDGVMPAAGLLIIDELRQVMEGVLLGKAGPEEFWESPSERVETFMRLVWSIRNAARFYGLDAQLGAPELLFINHVRGNSKGLPVVGNPREDNGGMFRWTDKQNTFKAALLSTIRDPERTKPVLVVTGGKGDQHSASTRGLSAWSLRRWIEAETAEEVESPHLDLPVTFSRVKVVVIDSFNKDKPEQRQILMDKDMGLADVVIVTPVAQSGFSFIGDFHEVGFVGGGLTLPPNCVSQGARRERTLKTCYGYLPTAVVDQNCPFITSDSEENARIILEAILDKGRDIDDLDPNEELMIATTLRYYERYISELALFTDYALAYLDQDGWSIEALEDIKLTQRSRKDAANDAKGAVQFEDLPETIKLILQGLSGELTNEQITAKENKAVSGGLVDLVGANAGKVVDLLQRSGLPQLCDGKPRAKDDPAVINCGLMLQSVEAMEILSRSAAIEGRPSRSADKRKNAVKAIGIIVRRLGGNWTLCGKGRSKVQGTLPVPAPEG